jgi:hypothetical protein
MWLIQSIVTAIFVLLGIQYFEHGGTIHIPEKIVYSVPSIINETPTPVYKEQPKEEIVEVDSKRTEYIKECTRYGYSKSECFNIWDDKTPDGKQVANGEIQKSIIIKHQAKDALDELVDKIQTASK